MHSRAGQPGRWFQGLGQVTLGLIPGTERADVAPTSSSAAWTLPGDVLPNRVGGEGLFKLGQESGGSRWSLQIQTSCDLAEPSASL